jgi:Flp pilus assembly protein TadG
MYRRPASQPAKLSVLRRGVAAVEAAVTLPMLVVLVVGALESANAIFLKQSMVIATYEAAKVASSPNGTTAFAEQRCGEVMTSRGVSTFNLTVTPNNLSASTARGTRVTVTLSVQSNSSILGPLWIFSGKTLQTKVDMVRL